VGVDSSNLRASIAAAAKNPVITMEQAAEYTNAVNQMNAQPSAHIFSFAPWRLVSDLPNSSIGEDFDLSMFGVRASYQCRQSGYMDMGDMMWPANEADNFLSISFSLAYE